MLKNIPLLITMDLEEFDIPLEYGQYLDPKEQMAVSLEGLKNILPILEKHQVSATFFTTAHWALQHVAIVQELAQKHEIASHAYWHSAFDEKDYKLSKETLENITQQPVYGFRMPRLRPVNFECLKKVGYTYDASINPTYLPGRYNNLSQPVRPYHNEQVFILPSSVTPILRIPLFWLSFKNLPNIVNRFLFKAIRSNGVFVFYIHPWEFANIEKYQLPNYIKRPHGEVLIKKLDDFLKYIAQMGHFMTCNDFFSKYTEGG
jgi:peptidoglycan/xylan/chitin deacetylase (PgdA/CDA1 family)